MITAETSLSIRKLVAFVETISNSSLILLTSVPELQTQVKKDEIMKDIGLFESQLKFLKDTLSELSLEK